MGQRGIEHVDLSQSQTYLYPHALTQLSRLLSLITQRNEIIHELLLFINLICQRFANDLPYPVSL
jgi:hypothetical protein